MEIDIKRLDHLGIISGVMKDLGLIEAIDKRLQKDKNNQEKITPGEGVAGMILNGLGFSDKPLSLTPQFFKTKALEVLFRPGIEGHHFNRHKLGKILDAVHEYGCEQLFYELSSQSCAQEAIDLRFNSEDTTSFSLTGEYDEDSDEHKIRITHGYSKDHRRDLKQVVQELLVSQDGGVPLMMKSWDGNSSDNNIFKARAGMLISQFKQSKSPRYLIADSKLYAESNAINLKQLKFITRIPGSISEEHTVIIDSIEKNRWQKLDDRNKFVVTGICHYGMEQRWIVVYSEKARERSLKTLERSVKKELIEIEKKLWHLSKQPYACAHDAEQAANALIKKCHYHKISEKIMTQKRICERAGRPKKGSEPAGMHYFITVKIMKDEDSIAKKSDEKSCYVIGTNTGSAELSAIEVIRAYKAQNASIENMGFRFLKDPIFFASSLFLKKPSRIMGLLMVMTLALLVYSIAQRRMRRILQTNNETLPNQINRPTQTPTMRWIFQLMDGIHFAKIKLNGVIKTAIQGINEIKRKIIGLMGETISQIYSIQENAISTAGGSSM